MAKNRNRSVWKVRKHYLRKFYPERFADKVTHIKISNKLTPSINYFYGVLVWLCKQKGIIEQPYTSWSSARVSHNKSGIFIPFSLQIQKQHVILECMIFILICNKIRYNNTINILKKLNREISHMIAPCNNKNYIRENIKTNILE